MTLFMIFVALVAIAIAVVPVTVVLLTSAHTDDLQDQAIQRWLDAGPPQTYLKAGRGVAVGEYRAGLTVAA